MYIVSQEGHVFTGVLSFCLSNGGRGTPPSPWPGSGSPTPPLPPPQPGVRQSIASLPPAPGQSQDRLSLSFPSGQDQDKVSPPSPLARTRTGYPHPYSQTQHTIEQDMLQAVCIFWSCVSTFLSFY